MPGLISDLDFKFELLLTGIIRDLQLDKLWLTTFF